MPTVDCSPLGAGMDVRPFGGDALDGIGLTEEVSAEARAFLEQPMVADSVIEADFDNDGERDRLMAVWARDLHGPDEECMTDLYVLAGFWGDAEEGPTVVDITCGSQRPWTLSERWGP